MTSLQPELWADRAAEAAAFDQAASGAIVLRRVGEGEDIVAQLAIGDAAFWVARAESAGPRVHPEAAGGATGRTLLVVDDPDAVFGQAVTAGATPLPSQPANTAGALPASPTRSATTGKSVAPWAPGRHRDRDVDRQPQHEPGGPVGCH
jgi:PhnB protein